MDLKGAKTIWNNHVTRCRDLQVPVLLDCSAFSTYLNYLGRTTIGETQTNILLQLDTIP
jgi:hypothetical protein